MFRILMNGNLMESSRIYGDALRKAERIKALFCKSGEVTVEDSRGFVLKRF